MLPLTSDSEEDEIEFLIFGGFSLQAFNTMMDKTTILKTKISDFKGGSELMREKEKLPLPDRFYFNQYFPLGESLKEEFADVSQFYKDK